MSRTRTRSLCRRTALVLALLAAPLAIASPAAAERTELRLITDGPLAQDPELDSYFAAESADGTRIAIAGLESMVGTDTDATSDVYLLTPGQPLVHVSDSRIGPDEQIPAHLAKLSEDGSTVVISTAERLLATDTDDVTDIYSFTLDGSLVQVSDGGGGVDPKLEALFNAATADASRVIFSTAERLLASDTDDAFDIYEAGPQGLRHISDSPAVDGPHDALFRELSADGNRVYFATRERLAASDTDNAEDIYRRAGAELSHLTDGAAVPDAELNAYFVSEAAGGARVYFETAERLDPSDTDNANDAYERGPGGALTNLTDTPSGIDAERSAHLSSWSRDGSVISFVTSERMAPTDTDDHLDVYLRQPGAGLVHLTDNPRGPDLPFDATLAGAAADGSRFVFSTAEPLTDDDGDASRDVYARTADGPPVNLSANPAGPGGPYDAYADGISEDGHRVVLETAERLAPTDTDDNWDVYLSREDGLTHVSDDPTGADDALDAVVRHLSPDGSRVYLATEESLDPADTDHALDAYLMSFAPDPAPPVVPPVVPPAVGDTTAPVLRGLAFAPRGKLLRFRLSEPARVRIALARKGGRARVFTVAGRAGANRVRLRGRLVKRPARRVRYRVGATPTDAAGNRGKQKTTRFAVPASKKRRSR